jgi:hypothetical protein
MSSSRSNELNNRPNYLEGLPTYKEAISEILNVELEILENASKKINKLKQPELKKRRDELIIKYQPLLNYHRLLTGTTPDLQRPMSTNNILPVIEQAGINISRKKYTENLGRGRSKRRKHHKRRKYSRMR